MQICPVLNVNNVHGQLMAVESGLGIAALPDYTVQSNPRVVQVIPEISGPSFDAYFVYPDELRDLKKIAAFRDFLLAKVSAWRF